VKVVVAGGTGFIGRHVVAALVDHGHEAIVLSRSAGTHAVGDMPRVTTIAADVTRPLDADAVRGADAVVNLVGIKIGRGHNTFAAAHVDAPRHLVEAMHAAGVRRLVHVSVVQTGSASGAYHATKRAGEAVVHGSGLDWTVLRPALVCGPGDDAITRLVQFVRAAPVFPVPGGPIGPLQLVDVRDVALAIVRALERPIAIGRTYDVVGPERVDLRTLAHRVAAALELRVATPALPRAPMRLAARLLERMPGDPLLTTSQLGMLVDGLHGDDAAARVDLDLTPRPVDAAAIATWAAHAPALLPSVRIVTGAEHRAWLRGCTRALPRLAWFAPLAIATLLAAPWLIADVWLRMCALEAALALVALVAVPLPWRELWRPRAGTLVAGALLGAVTWALALLVIAVLEQTAPAAIAPLPTMRAWASAWPLAAAVPMLVGVVAAEEIVWRSAIALPLAGRLGAWPGCIAAGLLFALAHVTTGPPILLVAALLAGTGWALFTVRTRSALATFVAHLVWDAALIWV
jgi:NADH dehydrogenase